ncbi:MAG: hypothetical protein FWC09_00225 [Lachnospiraceae bacterium]|nr:hypothetical protein [Lachnospiraceae bacterium]
MNENDIRSSRENVPFKESLSYTFMRIYRSKGKTLIVFALTTFLVGAVGFLAMTMAQYEELFETVKIKTTATGFSSNAIEMMSQSDLGDVVYYQGHMRVIATKDDFPVPLIVTNDTQRYIESIGFAGDVVIESHLALDENIIPNEKPILFMGRDIAKWLGIGLDDTLYLLEEEQIKALQFLYQSEEYLTSIGLADRPYEEILESIIAESSLSFKVVGLIQSNNAELDMSFFAPLHKAVHQINGLKIAFGEEGLPIILDFSEFQLLDNFRIDDYSTLLQEMASQSREDGSLDAKHFTDTSRLYSIAHVRDLLNVFFPIAAFIAIALSVVAIGLTMTQSIKEMALLRILGITANRTRTIFIFEHFFVTVIGTLLAMGFLMFFNIRLFANSASIILLFCVLYLFACSFTSFIASAVMAKKKPLELLQVKE